MKLRKDRRRRINFSIKRQMQIRILLKILIITAVGVGLMGLIFYIYSDRKIAASYTQFHIQARNFLDWLLPAVVASLVVALLGALVLSIFFPHRIAGPLYRIERDLQERVGNGDLTVRFILRKGDEVHDLAKAINTTLERLGNRIKELKVKVELLQTQLQKEDLDREKLKEYVDDLKKTLEKFKV